MAHRYLEPGATCRAAESRLRMGGRVVEGSGLENRQGCKLLVGSNPTPSASLVAMFLPQRVHLAIEMSSDPRRMAIRYSLAAGG